MQKTTRTTITLSRRFDNREPAVMRIAALVAKGMKP